jgi:hypothetical protein
MEVRLSAAPQAGEQVTVTVLSGDITATAGSDYVAVPATTLTFGPGETVKPMPVTILGDDVNEADEELVMHQQSVSQNANIADSEVSSIILDDDPLDGPSSIRWIYVTNAWVMEGNSGSTQAVFEVTLSSAPGPGESVSVTVETRDETAIGGSDYQTLAPTTLVFGPGEASKTVVVNVFGDTEGERLEQFLLWVVNSVGASQADKRGRAFINSEEGIQS